MINKYLVKSQPIICTTHPREHFGPTFGRDKDLGLVAGGEIFELKFMSLGISQCSIHRYLVLYVTIPLFFVFNQSAAKIIGVGGKMPIIVNRWLTKWLMAPRSNLGT